MFWRLNRLAAEIAEERKAQEPRRQHLMEAIKSYPADAAVQGNPWQHSSLQHLYNEVALILAESDVEAGESFLLEQFEGDPRFVYVFLPTWEEYYAKTGRSDRLKGLVSRIYEIYSKKLESDPDHREVIEACRKELDRVVVTLKLGLR